MRQYTKSEKREFCPFQHEDKKNSPTLRPRHLLHVVRPREIHYCVQVQQRDRWAAGNDCKRSLLTLYWAPKARQTPAVFL